MFAYKLVAIGTVEEKILAMQGEKRKLADAVVGESSETISRDEMRGLLQ